jgi:hypothetical protein
VAGEVGEELVDADAVLQDAGDGPAAASGFGLAGPWWWLIAVYGDDLGAELVEDVVVGVGAAAGLEGAEPVDDADVV